MITSQNVIDVYQELIESYQKYNDAVQKSSDARKNLETTRLLYLTTGRISGKNDDERKASARQELSQELEAVENLERLERTAKSRYDCASFNLECMKQQIRLLEIDASFQRHIVYRRTVKIGRRRA